MKKFNLLFAILVSLSLISVNVLGQDNNRKIHLKVVKNGETTVDTSFAAESLDDDELHKKISELAGVDVSISKGHHDIHKHTVHVDAHGDHTWTSKPEKGTKVVVVKSDKDGEEAGKVAYFYSDDDDHNFTIKGDSNVFIEADTIIMKKKGNVMIIKGGDETFEWIEKDSLSDKNINVIVEKVGEGDKDHNVIIMKNGDNIKEGDSHIILKEIDEDDIERISVVKVKKDDGGEEKTINVYVTDDEGDMYVHESGGVKIIVADEKNGTEIVSKKVKVVKSKGEGENVVEITVEVVEGEDAKFKEEPKKSQKKRNKKKKSSVKTNKTKKNAEMRFLHS